MRVGVEEMDISRLLNFYRLRGAREVDRYAVAELEEVPREVYNEEYDDYDEVYELQWCVYSYHPSYNEAVDNANRSSMSMYCDQWGVLDNAYRAHA